jgi:hypothetical protein
VYQTAAPTVVQQPAEVQAVLTPDGQTVLYQAAAPTVIPQQVVTADGQTAIVYQTPTVVQQQPVVEQVPTTVAPVTVLENGQVVAAATPAQEAVPTTDAPATADGEQAAVPDGEDEGQKQVSPQTDVASNRIVEEAEKKLGSANEMITDIKNEVTIIRAQIDDMRGIKEGIDDIRVRSEATSEKIDNLQDNTSALVNEVVKDSEQQTGGESNVVDGKRVYRNDIGQVIQPKMIDVNGEEVDNPDYVKADQLYEASIIRDTEGNEIPQKIVEIGENNEKILKDNPEYIKAMEARKTATSAGSISGNPEEPATVGDLAVLDTKIESSRDTNGEILSRLEILDAKVDALTNVKRSHSTKFDSKTGQKGRKHRADSSSEVTDGTAVDSERGSKRTRGAKRTRSADGTDGAARSNGRRGGKSNRTAATYDDTPEYGEVIEHQQSAEPRDTESFDGAEPQRRGESVSHREGRGPDRYDADGTPSRSRSDGQRREGRASNGPAEAGYVDEGAYESPRHESVSNSEGGLSDGGTADTPNHVAPVEDGEAQVSSQQADGPSEAPAAAEGAAPGATEHAGSEAVADANTEAPAQSADAGEGRAEQAEAPAASEAKEGPVETSDAPVTREGEQPVVSGEAPAETSGAAPATKEGEQSAGPVLNEETAGKISDLVNKIDGYTDLLKRTVNESVGS